MKTENTQCADCLVKDIIEDLIFKLDYVIKKGIAEKDGCHAVSAEIILNFIGERIINLPDE